MKEAEWENPWLTMSWRFWDRLEEDAVENGGKMAPVQQ